MFIVFICPVKTDGSNGNSVVLWCGGDEVFTVEWRVPAGTFNTSTLKSA